MKSKIIMIFILVVFNVFLFGCQQKTLNGAIIKSEEPFKIEDPDQIDEVKVEEEEKLKVEEIIKEVEVEDKIDIIYEDVDLVFDNGDKYTGQYANGDLNGIGTYEWVNGDTYTGEFVDGRLSGQGTFKWINGDVYTGEHKDGNMNGLGTFVWANGDKMTYVFDGATEMSKETTEDFLLEIIFRLTHLTK